jgi:hypothetical protein
MGGEVLVFGPVLALAGAVCAAGIDGRLAFVALRAQGEIDHHDSVFFTMPVSRMMPMSAMIEKSVSVSRRAIRAPTPAEGRVERSHCA